MTTTATDTIRPDHPAVGDDYWQIHAGTLTRTRCACGAAVYWGLDHAVHGRYLGPVCQRTHDGIGSVLDGIGPVEPTGDPCDRPPASAA